MDIQPRELLEKAASARDKAYAPYSKFRVGAALLSAAGNIYTGCNMENASYGLTICAERGAFAQAIAAGEREFAALAIVGAGEADSLNKPCWPCGICRQTISEFCDDDFPIYVASGDGWELRTLGQLLPEAFRLDTSADKG